MRISDITWRELNRELRGPGVALRTGPFVVRIRSSIDHVAGGLRQLYGDHAVAEPGEFTDFHIGLVRPKSHRRWLRPQVLFMHDSIVPFKPLPVDQAVPMLEWGLNWVIANHSHQYLILHAAAVEKGGYCAIMSAPPGSGKSTLCAGLVARGWRLLSDELAIVSTGEGSIVPLARPISLKNESIGVIGGFAPDAVIGGHAADTMKGTVALMKPPLASVVRARQPARPRWLVFPRYEPDAPASLEPSSKARMLMHFAEHAFNYSILGLTGFESLSRLVDESDCYSFTYSRLEEAVDVFDGLASRAQSAHC